MKIIYDGIEKLEFGGICSTGEAMSALAEFDSAGTQTNVVDISLIELVPTSADEVRQLRAPLLVNADILVNKAEDLGTASKITAARNYRKALRDITNDVTDYATITWPTPPVV